MLYEKSVKAFSFPKPTALYLLKYRTYAVLKEKNERKSEIL